MSNPYSHFHNQWIMKRSRQPFHGGKTAPALFVRHIYFRPSCHAHHLVVNRKGGEPIPDIKITEEHADNYIIVSKQEAAKYNKLFEECSRLSPAHAFVSNPCVREDNGKPKMDLGDNFQHALYWLKLKEPQCLCQAYKCPKCGGTHVGKITKANLLNTFKVFVKDELPDVSVEMENKRTFKSPDVQKIWQEYLKGFYKQLHDDQTH